MSRPARFTQGDIVRAFRAAEKVEKDVRVVVHPDGRIVIEPVNSGESVAAATIDNGDWVL